MMPHQIFCDYLEDKGIDTRLLRIVEGEGLTLQSNKIDRQYHWRQNYFENGDGKCNSVYTNGDNDTAGYGNFSGDGASDGFNYSNGDGMGTCYGYDCIQ